MKKSTMCAILLMIAFLWVMATIAVYILVSVEANTVDSCEVKIDTENADTDEILASVATLLRGLMSKTELPYHLWKAVLLLAYSGANMQEGEE